MANILDKYDFQPLFSGEPPPKKPSYTHTSDKRVVVAFSVRSQYPDISQPMPGEEATLVLEKSVKFGVPIQVQIEITPQACMYDGFYVYHCCVNSVKACIKPGTLEFGAAEEKMLNHIIEGTEDTAQAEEKAKKREQKEESKANRFTGLEIS